MDGVKATLHVSMVRTVALFKQETLEIAGMSHHGQEEGKHVKLKLRQANAMRKDVRSCGFWVGQLK